MIQFIWADDEFLASEVVDAFCAQASGEDEVITLSCEADVSGLEEALFASSLFATNRYVVIRRAEQLRKDGIARLASAVGSSNLGADVVVVATSDYQPTQLTKALQDVAKVRKLPRPRRGQLVAWVADRLKTAGLKADRETPGTLIEAVGEGLRDLAHAVDQLALRRGKAAVTRKDVLEQFSLSAEQPIWVLFDAIVRHEGPKAFDTLRRSLHAGDEPLAVLFALVSQVRYLIRAKAIIERSRAVGEDDLARVLGVSTGRAAVLRRQAARLSWEWLLGVHRLLAEADFELKGGEDGAVLPSDVILERVVAGALEAG